MPEQIAEIRRIREAEHLEGPFVIGGMTGWCYVGKPSWSCGPVSAGTPEQLTEVVADFRDIGVQHLMVRFRSRSCAEQCDQIEAFGRDVLPLL